VTALYVVNLFKIRNFLQCRFGIDPAFLHEKAKELSQRHCNSLSVAGMHDLGFNSEGITRFDLAK